MIRQGAKQLLGRAEDPLRAIYVERDNSLSRGFDTRRKRGSAINQRILCGFFLFAVTPAENNTRALRRLGFGAANFDTGKLGVLVTRGNSRQRIGTIKNGNRAAAPSQSRSLP